MEKKFHLKMMKMILTKMMSFILMNRKLFKLKAVMKIGKTRKMMANRLKKKKLTQKRNKKINRKLKLPLKFGMIQKNL
jgi:hypothetical protein